MYGETLEERNDGKFFDIVENEVKKALEGVEELFVKRNIVIAYEPIWAIGTGVVASSDDAEDMCKFIRKTVEKMYGKNVSESVRILYGGSVGVKTASEIITKENIDGVLVGSASLKNDFTAIVNY